MPNYQVTVSEGTVDGTPVTADFRMSLQEFDIILINKATGTNIGDMTSGGGLAAAFNNQITQTAATCATKATSTSGYVGKTLVSPAIFARVLVRGSSDQGFVSTTNPTVTLTAYGKTGAAPTSATNGTVLGTISLTDTTNEMTGRQIDSIDNETEWNHLWVTLSTPSASNLRIGEIAFYEWGLL